MEPNNQLTRFPSGSLRELLYLSIPLILSLFSASFMGFCDRVFLAHYSLQAFEESVSAGYLCVLFQQPIIRITSMAQVFVGLYLGSNQKKKIGQSVWQMIWLSVLSMLVTLPFSQFVAPFFFQGTPMQGSALTYFNVLMTVNFLFPLAAGLSSYFIGQGRTRIIFLITLLSHGLNILLDYFFIFGLGNVIPQMGIFGAALATAISQGVFCLILMVKFLNKEEKENFGTHDWRFSWESFWSQMRVGLPRAVARVIILTAWVATARIMILKGGDYLAILSVGGTLTFLFTFINDGMLQGMITISSNLMGSKRFEKIWKLARSGALFLLCSSTLIAIPHLIFPEWTLSFFKIENQALLPYLKKSCIWIWLYFMFYGVQMIGLSIVTAARDVTFYMFTISLIWLSSYTPAYIGINYFNWPPDSLWLLMALDSLLYGTIYLLRASKEKWREEQLDATLASNT